MVGSCEGLLAEQGNNGSKHIPTNSFLLPCHGRENIVFAKQIAVDEALTKVSRLKST